MGSLDPEIEDNSPIADLNRFYAAERRYMKAGGKGTFHFHLYRPPSPQNPIFHNFANLNTKLPAPPSLTSPRPSPPPPSCTNPPDPPWGGDWAAHMSSVSESVDVQDAEFLQSGGKVVVVCTLLTKTRKTGDVMRRPMVQVVTAVEGRIVVFRPFYWCVPDYRRAAEGLVVAE